MMRFRAALSAMTPDQRRTLARRLSRQYEFAEAPPPDDADPMEWLGRVLVDPEHIRARDASLDPTLSAVLREAMAGPIDANPVIHEADALFGAGLGILAEGETPGARLLHIPWEVQVALTEDVLLQDAPLSVHLARMDDEDLEEIAGVWGIALDSTQSALDWAWTIADALLEPDRLSSLHESLPVGARRLLLWLCERGTPIGFDAVRDRAHHLAESLPGSAVEGGRPGERILLRTGIACLARLAGKEWVVVPWDVRDALAPLHESELNDRCGEAYQRVRSAAVHAFPDVLPRGFGGDPLVVARLRMMRAIAEGIDPAHPLDAILQQFTIIDAEGRGPGSLASVHLDVRSPDAFGRELLRTWLTQLDDPWTRQLLAAFGADTTALAAVVPTQRSPDGEVPLGENLVWPEFLWQLRAHIVLVLSALPEFQWFRVDTLAEWVTAVFRRTVWFHGAFHLMHDDAPIEALPDSILDIGPHTNHAVQGALTHLLETLFAPIGIAALDASRQLVVFRPDPLRALRDLDPHFDHLWAGVEVYLGDDLNAWAPGPSEIGNRTATLSPLRWIGSRELEVDADAHTNDLVRLATWSEPGASDRGFRVRFTASSVQRGREDDEDPAEFLAWLHVRSRQSIPDETLALFEVAGTAVDRADSGFLRAARARVQTIWEQLRLWGDFPPSHLVEELRGWGDVAESFLCERLEQWIRRRRWREPRLIHALVVLGELGSHAAIPNALRCIAYGTTEAIEGAASLACARIGAPAFDGLHALLHNEEAELDKRVIAAGALSAVAILHPSLCAQVAASLRTFLDAGELEPDVATQVALYLAETGHADVETTLYQIKEQGLWLDDIMPFDEAMWIARSSPCMWGHPMFSGPIAHLYPGADQSSEVQRAAGVDDLMTASGIDPSELLGRVPKAGVRRRRREDS